MSLTKWLRPRPARTHPRRSQTRLGVHQLEDRATPTTGLVSALSVGNDIGGTQARNVAVDAAGNSYLAGLFTGTVDFDPARTLPSGADILTSRGGTDAYVAKYAADGSLTWARRMGGADPGPNSSTVTDVIGGVEIDGAGNVYVVGRFTGSGDFGTTTLTSVGGQEAFAAKLDAAGTVKWASRWGSVGHEYEAGVGVDAGGNVYGLSVRVGDGYDIVKFSPTGQAVWSKYVGTRSTFVNADLEVDAAGNAFVGGSFQGTVDFDPGAKTKAVSSGPGTAAFALKLDTKGSFGWVSPFVGQSVGGTSGYSQATSIALDGAGGVVIGGSYGGPVDFNPGSGATVLPGAKGGFVAKLGNTGGLTWVRGLETSSLVSVYDLTVDTTGNVYATGQFRGTTDFDPGAGTASRTSAGGSDVFALKLNSAGSVLWAETFGSTGDDIGWGVAVDGAGTVSLAGAYVGTVDFDPDPASVFEMTTPGPYRNGYLVKLSQS